MAGIFRGIIFHEKSKERSRINFHGFNFCDCHAVDHAHRDPLVLVLVHKLVVINFCRVKIFVTAESTTKISTP